MSKRCSFRYVFASSPPVPAMAQIIIPIGVDLRLQPSSSQYTQVFFLNNPSTSATLHNSVNSAAALAKAACSTPVKLKQQGFQDTSSSPAPLASLLHLLLDEEMRQCFVGPVSIETFFEDFLPVENVPTPSVSSGFKNMASAKSEKYMYPIFVRHPTTLAFFSSIDDKPSRLRL